MATSKGKTIGLILLVMLILLVAFEMSPFYLAPFGIFSGIFHTIKGVFMKGFGIFNGHIFGFRPFPFFSIIIFFIWIMVIVWVFRDAERRGLNGLLWALLVLIGNLIGLIIYLIIRNGKTKEEAGVEEESTAVDCIHCGKPVDPGFAFCPGCGKSLKDLCPNCSSEVKGDWQVCPHCGKKLS